MTLPDHRDNPPSLSAHRTPPPPPRERQRSPRDGRGALRGRIGDVARIAPRSPSLRRPGRSSPPRPPVGSPGASAMKAGAVRRWLGRGTGSGGPGPTGPGPSVRGVQCRPGSPGWDRAGAIPAAADGPLVEAGASDVVRVGWINRGHSLRIVATGANGCICTEGEPLDWPASEALGNLSGCDPKAGEDRVMWRPRRDSRCGR